MECEPLAAWSTFALTIITAVTAIFAIFTWRSSIKQRKKEHRLFQIDEAKKLLLEMFSHKPTLYAFRMLENDPRLYKIEHGYYKSITYSMVIETLSKNINDIFTENMNDRNVKVEYFICECFSDLFYYFDRIKAYIDENSLTLKELQSPLEYYIEIMTKNKYIFLKYRDQIKSHAKSIDFLDQFEIWKKG